MILSEGLLSVSDIHSIYYIHQGNPGGPVILSLHGGPGGHSKSSHLESLDLDVVQVVQIDQRGCGQSTPAGEIRENTLDDLVDDIEKIREHLGIDTWYVSGASWGSTLALVYAQRYPERVQGLFVTSVFLGREQDIDWLNNGVQQFFPELETFREHLLEGEHMSNWRDLSYNWIMSEDEELQRRSLAISASWEGNVYQLESRMRLQPPEDMDLLEVPGARVYHHYDQHRFFMDGYSILDNCAQIAHIPIMILHGRYDMMCPPEQAYILHRQVPLSRLEITNFDGHKISAESRRVQRYMWRELLQKK